MRYIPILILSLIAFSCKSIDTKSNHKDIIQRINFGSGGGIIGKEISYTLTKEGTILQKKHTLNTLSKQENKVLQKRVNTIKDYRFKETANTYQFLEIISVSDTNRIVWATNSRNVKQEITTLHHLLYSHIK